MSTASKLFIGFVILGMFFRVFQPLTRLSYGHDADLSSWIVKDIIIDGHPRLIGQLTSAPGIFIGSLFYYSLIPAYWLAHFDPAGSLIWSWALSLISLISIFWVTYKLYGKKAALVTLFTFAISFDIAQTERTAVPTALVFVWTTWFYYLVRRLFQGQTKSLYGLAVLFALVWHIHLALALLFPVVVLGLVLNIKKINVTHLILSALLGLVLISPLGLFEVKHNFQQTRAFLAGEHVKVTTDRILHTLAYAARNLNETYWSRPEKVSVWLLPVAFILTVAYLTWKKVYSASWAVALIVWYGVVLYFFTTNPINLSEYYLHGLNIVWIISFGIFISRLNWKLVGIILGLLLVANLNRLFSFVPNHAGYVERKELTQFLAAEAAKHNYPCIAVSYMTDPGNNLGYRYLFYQLNLVVDAPSTEAPVYTIVFPHPRANHLDATFGALGVVLPDYARYTPEGVRKSCSGPNENVTGLMFGFTK